MDIDVATPAGQSLVAREKECPAAPFLIRAFVKIGSFHRLSLFEDGMLPTTDEVQLYTWKDATLREVLTTLRNAAPQVPEYRHPLARFSFRAVYTASTNKGLFAQRDLGTLTSRDILGEAGSVDVIAPSLLEDAENDHRNSGPREKEERCLEELRFVPGDYLLVAVMLPKNVTVSHEISIKGSGTNSGWRGGGNDSTLRPDGGWAGPVTPVDPGAGRSGGHWRGDSHASLGRGGRGGRGGVDSGRDRIRDRDPDKMDRRVPPPRRSTSPPRGGNGWGDRGRRGGRGPDKSRSRTPPRRRPRYD